MNEEQSGFRKVMSSLYEWIDRQIAISNKTYEEELNEKADALGDDPSHTLAYYENTVDNPMNGLSLSDLRAIKKWMQIVDKMPDALKEPELSSRDRRLVNKWMKKSEDLPLILKSSGPGLFGRISIAWDDFCGKRYLKRLEEYEEPFLAKELAQEGIIVTEE